MNSIKNNALESAPLADDVADLSETKATPAQAADFSGKLGEAIAKVDASQVEADEAAKKLGAGEGNLHETMLALEKADVTMRVAMKVRNKILDAYNEVMRMPV
ncbi:MAG: flagellar hook-basal body complex protein FliE [Archangium sp.]